MAEYCLTLICPPSVEEKLLDALLLHVGDELFTSSPTFSHGTPHGRLSPTEQVMGRSRSVQVEVLLSAEEWQVLRGRLGEEFAGTGLRFWAHALVMEGEF
jgi:hypothetical protein